MKNKIELLLAMLFAAGIMLFAASVWLLIARLPGKPEQKQAGTSPLPYSESAVCIHPEHDRDTQLCTICGEKVCHEYGSSRICRCGKELRFTSDYFDPALWEPCEQKGSVETLAYTTRDLNGEEHIKHLEVYLPYGYDPAEQYNVLVLLHGANGDEHYWFKERGYVYPWGDSPWEKFTTVFDNMIRLKICRPLIIVSPTYYLSEEMREGGTRFEDDVQQMRFEVLSDMLPAVVSRYSTYAAGPDYASLCNARDHFGFLGASYGGRLCCNAILTYDLDVFSWAGAVSGLAADVPEMNGIWNTLGFDALPVHFLYTAAGEQDPAREDTVESYAALLAGSAKISEANSCYVEVAEAAHEERVWDNAVYDCLQLFF